LSQLLVGKKIRVTDRGTRIDTSGGGIGEEIVVAFHSLEWNTAKSLFEAKGVCADTGKVVFFQIRSSFLELQKNIHHEN
jgi:hypothetical protein